MTQNEAVLAYIREHGSISPADAYEDLGIIRLAARVLDLREQGLDIETMMVPHKGGHHARYRLAQPDQLSLPLSGQDVPACSPAAVRPARSVASLPVGLRPR